MGWIFAGNVLGRLQRTWASKNTVEVKMSLNDPLANVFSHMLNYEKIGRAACIVRPSSKLTKKVLEIIKNNGYIEDFKEIEVNKFTP